MVSMGESKKSFEFGWNFDFNFLAFPSALTESGNSRLVVRRGNPNIFDTSFLASTP